MATTLQKRTLSHSIERVSSGLWSSVERASEWFWFLLSFILFVVLGPFSAPIALLALFKLGLEENDHQEPESISTN